MVKDVEFSKLENPKIGTSFELNDHRGTIVGIARVASNGLILPDRDWHQHAVHDRDQLYRSAQGPQNRALRHLQELAPPGPLLRRGFALLEAAIER